MTRCKKYLSFLSTEGFLKKSIFNILKKIRHLLKTYKSRSFKQKVRPMNGFPFLFLIFAALFKKRWTE
jgi:hypothetical protein